MQALGGAKNHAVLMPDADIANAVSALMGAAYGSCGERCMAIPLVVAVGDAAGDAIVAGLKAEIAKMKVGPGTEPGISIGPMINEAAIAKINRHVEDALSKGAKVVTQKPVMPKGSQYTAPVVLTGATTEMLLASEETFGPVAPLFRFETEAEAIAMANDTEFGLAAYFFTRDVARCWRVGEALEYGMVGINVGILATEHVPFGGVKQSGLGREGSHHGMDDYVEIKYLCLGDILR